MDRKFWNRIAGKYDDEVFDTLQHDRGNVIVSHIDRLSSKNSMACDFGCGIGKYLPLLGDRFETVYAVDQSEKCLELARKVCRGIDNVIFCRNDLADHRLKLQPVHFALSVNVLIMPSFQTRALILKNIFRHTGRGGRLLLVVPSLESELFQNFRLQEWNRRTKSRRAFEMNESLRADGTRGFSLPNGILNRDGALTKHYLKEELMVLLGRIGFEIESVKKVEYPWTTEFIDPPRWMKDPYPWDWLVVCRKN